MVRTSIVSDSNDSLQKSANMKSHICGLAYLIVLLLNGEWAVEGQWVTQRIQLQPGWNAVFLEVQPEPRECDAVFSGLPLESVWRWNRRFTSVQFINDPNQLIAEPDAWLAWINPAHPVARKSTLFIVEGGLPYLIKSTNTTPVTWSLKGQPVRRPIEWLSDSLNLVGFPLSETGQPTFQALFAGASGLTNQPIYRMDSAGRWVQVLAPATSSPAHGEAFWIRSVGTPVFQGPVQIALNSRLGLDFGRTLTEDTVRLKNNTTVPLTLTVRPLNSESPPASDPTALAGPVVLGVWKDDFVGRQVGWTAFPAILQSNVPPGGTWEIRLEARRRDFVSYSPVSGVTASRYQSLLEVVDGANLSRQVLGVSADGIGAPKTSARLLLADVTGTPGPRAGLWVGSATVTNVSQPSAQDPTLRQPAASEFSFRVLMHVDAGGQPRLLQKVLQMFRPGTYKSANDGTTNQVVDQPGRFVLVTDDKLIPNFQGVAVRDSAVVGRRISSSNFSFRDPLALGSTGAFGVPGVRVGGSIFLDYRDPLNPFVHRFHPDHDNLDERFETTLPEGQESFSVTRALEFEFLSTDPENLQLSGWGDTQLGGIYRETISGLHRSPILVSGTFRINLASRVDVLNDGL